MLFGQEFNNLISCKLERDAIGHGDGLGIVDVDKSIDHLAREVELLVELDEKLGHHGWLTFILKTIRAINQI